MYADEEFTELVKRFKTVLKEVVENATSAAREWYRCLFWTAAQYDLSSGMLRGHVKRGLSQPEMNQLGPQP